MFFVFISVLFILITAGCLASQETHQLEQVKEQEQKQEYDQGSGMKFSSLSEQKIEDFAKLSKVWGVVKRAVIIHHYVKKSKATLSEWK